MAHTPGPWRVAPTSLSVRTADKFDRLVVYGNPDNSNRHDDARLIAAAPDLLSIAKRWAALDGSAWDVRRHASERAELLTDTRAAIAKATGEK